MAQENLVLADEPEPESGWEFHVNFKEWGTEVLLSWLSELDEDEDFRDQYEGSFEMHQITGLDFTRTKLGNEQWCREKFNMTTANHARQFSDIVRHRIKEYENYLKRQQQQPPQQPVNLIDIPLKQIQQPAIQHNDNDDHIQIPPKRDQSLNIAPQMPQNQNQNQNGGILNGANNFSPLQHIEQNQFHDEEKEQPKPAFHVYTEANEVTPGSITQTTRTMGEAEPQQQSSWKDAVNNLPDHIARRQSQQQQQQSELAPIQNVVNRALSLSFLNNQAVKPPVKASGSYSGSQSVDALNENIIALDHNAPAPDLPFVSHPQPSMRSMSNKFRAKGPNKIMYPPKNGPIAVAKRLGISVDDLPPFDPHDEIYGDSLVSQSVMLKFAQELSQLTVMGYTDHDRNLRHLLRLSVRNDSELIMSVIEAYVQPQKFEGIFIGDRVVRGADWKWGEQDGGRGLEGTVRGLRQWHPHDPSHVSTSAVVLWDHGLYGNYRFGYKSAYDLTVIDRMTDEKQNNEDRLLSVGDRVCRAQLNWRWGQQDGGPSYGGTVIELYASPAPFEGGCRVGVIWDHARARWKDKAREYLKAHPNGDDEFYAAAAANDNDDNKNNNNDDDEDNNEPGTQEKSRQILVKFKRAHMNPHQVRKKRKKYVEYESEYESEEHSSEWDEPDFEEILSKPVAKYRWQLEDTTTAYGVASDLEIVERKDLADRNFLMIDDRVRTSMYFSPRRKAPKSQHGIVLKVEQADATRVLPNEIKGDKVYTTWSSYQWYKFKADDGLDDIMFYKRGQVFQDEWSRIKVGDRVRRGLTWKNEYGEEDGGHEKKGTVVCIQYVLQCVGMLAKVRWDKNGHTNFYSWGFKDIYDLRKIPSQK